MERTEQRIDRLERLVADLDARVGLLEHPGETAARAPLPRAPQPSTPAPARHAPAPAPQRLAPASARPVVARHAVSREELEDLVGGRVLAWVGGLAVLLGLVFLFKIGRA